MALWQWSKTPIANQTADPTINWSEGQAPSTVNDSDRAMMARIAEFRDDISGSLTLAGGPVTYTVTTNQGLPSPPSTGQILSFTPNVTNGANATIAADAGTAFPIQISPGVAVASNTLIVGTPYSASFNGSAWVLFSTFSNPLLIPVGGMVIWVATVLPNSNFAWPNGQAISRTINAQLFALIGTFYGTGDGSTTFNIPNLNGVGLFVQDNMGGLNPRGTITTGNGNWDGTALARPYYPAPSGNPGTEQRTVGVTNLPAHTHSGTTGTESATHTHTGGGSAGNLAGAGVGGLQSALVANTNTGTESATHNHAFTTDSGTGGGNPMATMPPGISMPLIMRIL